MEGGSRGGEVDLNIISRLGEVKVIFCLVRGGGGYDLILSRILPISQPPPPPGNYCIVPNETFTRTVRPFSTCDVRQ